MALARVDSSVGIQPAGGYQQVDLGMASRMEAQQWGAAQQTSMTLFDMVKRDYDQDAIRRAQVDAPAMVKRDGTGALIPVSDFSPPGGYFNSAAYKNAYRDAGQSTYSVMAQQDFQNSATEILAKYPNDPAKAKLELEAKRDAMVSELDPRYAPTLTLHLNGMIGQVATRINANVIDQGHKTAEKNALWSYEGVIQHAAAYNTIPDNFDPGAGQINNALLLDKIKTTDAEFDKAGWTKDQKDYYWKHARIKAVIARDKAALEQAVFEAGGDPVKLQQSMLDARAYIDKTAATMGADAEAYKQALRTSFGEMAWRNQARASIREGVAQGQDAQAELKINKRRQDAIINNPNGNPDPMGDMRAERDAIYTDPTLTDVQRLRRLGIYDRGMGAVTGDLQSYATQKANLMVTEMNHADTPPDRSRAIKQDLITMSSDPRAKTYLTTETKVGIDNAISKIATNEFQTDAASMIAHSNMGLVKPDDLRDWGARNQHRIGTAPNSMMSPVQWQNLVETNRAAYGQRQYQDNLARFAEGQANAGTSPIGESRKALAVKYPVLPNGQIYNPQDPDHRDAATANLAATMNVDENVAGQIRQSVSSGDFNQVLAAREQYIGMKSALMQSKGFSQEKAIAWLRQDGQLGDVIDLLAVAPTMEPKEFWRYVQNKATASVSRDMRESKGAAVETFKNNVPAELEKIRREGATLGIGPRLNFVDGLSPQQQQVQTILANKAMTTLDSAMFSLSSFLPQGSTALLRSVTGVGHIEYRKLSLDPQVQDLVLKKMTAIRGDGGQVMDAAHPGMKGDSIAFRQALERYMPNLEWATNPQDTSEGILQLKSVHTRLGEAGTMGRPLTDQELKGTARAIVETERTMERQLGLRESLYGDVDPSTITMRQHMSSDGSMSVKVIGNLRGSTTEQELLEMGLNDPRLSSFFMDLNNGAQKLFEQHWKGKSATPDDGSLSYLGSKVAAFVSSTVGGLYSGVEKQASKEDALKAFSYDPKDRAWIARAFDSIFGHEPNDPYRYRRLIGGNFGSDPNDPKNRPNPNIDLPKLRESIINSKDAATAAKLRDIYHLSNVEGRTPPGPQANRPQLPQSPPLDRVPTEAPPPGVQIEKMTGLRKEPLLPPLEPQVPADSEAIPYKSFPAAGEVMGRQTPRRPRRRSDEK